VNNTRSDLALRSSGIKEWGDLCEAWIIQVLAITEVITDTPAPIYRIRSAECSMRNKSTQRSYGNPIRSARAIKSCSPSA
jgi:hypothetical protein